MSLEEARKLFGQVSETDDVGEKRFLMYRMLEQILDELEKDSFSELSGLKYKLAQDFLVSSSTYEKTRNIEKLMEHVERTQSEDN